MIKLPTIFFSFQSPFGELKIGKLARESTLKSLGFQSPFGELKIGKFMARVRDFGILAFQSPFGELKIGKVK